MKYARTAGLVLVVAVAAILLLLQRAPGVPGYFDQSLRYDAAVTMSKETGKPVFALVSADWCGPCHQFEGGALIDARVVSWITANTVPLFLDASDQGRPGAEAAARLGVTGIPAIFLIKGGQVVGRHEGVLDAESLLNWLETFSKEEPAPITPAG